MRGRGHPRAAGADVDDGPRGVLGRRGEARRCAAPPAPREIGACDTATVGASSRISSGSAAGAPTACASSAGSSHRTNDAAIPTRSCPCLRATSSMRYVRPCGTGVFECRSNRACNSPAVRPVSSARRIDGSLIRYTIAAPADSTVATAANFSASSRSSGPGTMTVRSACSRKWSMGSGSTLAIASDGVARRRPAACAPGR